MKRCRARASSSGTTAYRAVRRSEVPLAALPGGDTNTIFGVRELFLEIAQNLALQTLVRCARVCKQWQESVYAALADMPYVHLPFATSRLTRATLDAFRALLVYPALEHILIRDTAPIALAAINDTDAMDVQCYLGSSYRRPDPNMKYAEGIKSTLYIEKILLRHTRSLRNLELPLAAACPFWNDYVLEIAGALDLLSGLRRLVLNPVRLDVNCPALLTCTAMDFSDAEAVFEEGLIELPVAYDTWFRTLPPGLATLRLANLSLECSDHHNVSSLSMEYRSVQTRAACACLFRRDVLRGLDALTYLETLELDWMNCNTALFTAESDSAMLIFFTVEHIRYSLRNLELGAPTLGRLRTLSLTDTMFDVPALFASLLGVALSLHTLTIKNTPINSLEATVLMDGTPNIDAREEQSILFPAASCAQFTASAQRHGTLPQLAKLVLVMEFRAAGFVLVRHFMECLPALEELTLRALETKTSHMHYRWRDMAMPRALAPGWIGAFVLPRAAHALRILTLDVLVRVSNIVERNELIELLTRFPCLERARVVCKQADATGLSLPATTECTERPSAPSTPLGVIWTDAVRQFASELLMPVIAAHTECLAPPPLQCITFACYLHLGPGSYIHIDPMDKRKHLAGHMHRAVRHGINMALQVYRKEYGRICRDSSEPPEINFSMCVLNGRCVDVRGEPGNPIVRNNEAPARERQLVHVQWQ